MRITAGILALILIPFFAFAQTQSGFPDRSLWLSNAKPAYGEEIKIYTVVYNGTDIAFTGTLTFLLDGKALDSQSVALGAQSSEVVATKWKATSGSHTFGARFGVGTSTADNAQQTASIQIQVPEPPPPTALQESVSVATDVATSLASTSAPIVTKVASAVFEKTEAIRSAGIEYLESKLDAEPETASPGLVAGTSTSPTAKSANGFGSSSAAAAGSGTSSTLHSIGQYAAAALLFGMKNVYLFYPIFAFLFFYLLYRAYRLFRRPY